MPQPPEQHISSDFPYKSKFVEVRGSKMHYIEQGSGDPVLFLHGNPTSSYLWRNIIPHVSGQARCIAPDLIGMGKSDKPDIDYTFADHYAYLEDFIEKLGLKNITLVIHDWGSGLGFHYAHQHQDNVRGIAFMEAMVKPLTWDGMPSAKLRVMFKMLRAPFVGWLMVSVANMFVNKMIPDMIVRKLSKEEHDHYREPYPTIASRKPVRVWPQEVPFDGSPAHTHKVIDGYGKWLTQSDLPKLCLYTHPGAIILEDVVTYIKENIPNTEMVDLGEGLHFIQEDHPEAIGKAIGEWYGKL